MQHSLQGISTLIFDFGGVLINLNRQTCIAAFEDLGVKNLDKVLGDYGQTGFFSAFEEGAISAAEFRNSVRALSERRLTDTQIDSAWCAFLEDVPSSKLDLLIALRKKYRVLMLSNTNPIHIEFCKETVFKYKGHNMSDFFDKCYFSYDMHLSKPSQEIFQMLLAEEQIAPSEALFFDDGPANIEAAQALGLQTCLIFPFEELPAFLNRDIKP